MNKTKIEYGDRNWPVVTGCKRGCDYCWARRLFNRFGWSFEPMLHIDRLSAPLRMRRPCKVLTCFTGDLFGPWIKADWGWQREVIEIARRAHWHTFLFLTKYPENLPTLGWPPNAWVGATVTNHDEAREAMSHLQHVDASIRYLSCEPLLDWINLFAIRRPDWLIVGAQTGPRAKPPEFEWVRDLSSFAKGYGVPLFLKDNLNWCEPCQEFPNG